MNYFYILRSSKDDKLYYGSTTNLKKRFIQHNNGEVISTRFRRPLTLVYYEAYTDLDRARVRERQVKRSGSIRSALIKRIV